MEKRIWIPPCFCGCEFEITAEWTEPAIIDAEGRPISYLHPKSRTYDPVSKHYTSYVSEVKSLKVCPQHSKKIGQPIGKDPYKGLPGYIDYDRDLTNSEKLYIYFFRYSGQIWKPDTCECTIYMSIIREEFIEEGENVIEFLPHPIHTKKCSIHSSDTDLHSQAILECSYKNYQLNEIAVKNPHLIDENTGAINNDKISWAYDNDRNLSIIYKDTSDKPIIQAFTKKDINKTAMLNLGK